MNDLARRVSAGQQRIRQSAACNWICYCDHEHAGVGFLRPTHRDSVNFAGRRMVIEEYSGLHGSRGRGTERVECLAAETSGPDDVKSHQ